MRLSRFLVETYVSFHKEPSPRRAGGRMEK
jgi:hypothetical protein